MFALSVRLNRAIDRIETLERQVDELKDLLRWVGLNPNDKYSCPDVRDIRERQEMIVEYLGLEVKCTDAVPAMCRYVKKEDTDEGDN